MVKRTFISVLLAFCLLLSFGVVKANASNLVYHVGFETGDLIEVPTVSGSVSINPTVVNTGNYSCQLLGSSYIQFGSASMSAVTTYFRFSENTGENIIGASGGIRLFFIGGGANRIRLFDSDGAIDTGSTLSPNTWYRISVGRSGTDIIVYLDGDVYISTVEANAGDDFLRRFSAGTGDTFYFDDIAISETASTADIGDVRVLRAIPNSEGFHQEQSSGAYTDIDEVPGVAGPGGGQVFIEADGTTKSYTANFSDKTDLGLSASDNIQAVASWFYYDTAGGGDPQYFSLVRDNATDYPTAVDDSKVDVWVSRYDATEPNSGTDWDWESYDAFQAGMETDDANKDLWINTLYMMVAYIPPSGACSPNIGNLPITYDYGVVAESATPGTTINYFTVTNSSGGAISITIKGTDMTGGVTWTLSDTATPGSNVYGLKCGLDDADDNFDIIVKKNATYNDLVSGLADSGTQDWGLQLLAPDTTTDGAEKTGTVTLTATCD